MRYTILGVAITALQILFFAVLRSKKKMLLPIMLLFAILACLQGRIGILLVFISAVAAALVLFFKQIVKDKSFGVIIATVFVLLISLSAYLSMNYSGSFENDVLYSYLGNLYGTSRFTAVPVLDICIMHFIYAIFAVYYGILRKQIGNEDVFGGISIVAFAYLVIIGACYTRTWAKENMAQFGEYLTGFSGYMMTVASLYYSFIVYSIVLAITKKRVK